MCSIGSTYNMVNLHDDDVYLNTDLFFLHKSR